MFYYTSRLPTLISRPTLINLTPDATSTLATLYSTYSTNSNFFTAFLLIRPFVNHDFTARAGKISVHRRHRAFVSLRARAIGYRARAPSDAKLTAALILSTV